MATDRIDAHVIATIPLIAGAGHRTIAVAEGTGLVFTARDGHGQPDQPDQAFDARQASEIARRVLAGHARTMTDPDTLRVLAAAVLLLDHQLTPRS